MTLAGIVVPGARVPAVPGRNLKFLNGKAIEAQPTQPEQEAHPIINEPQPSLSWS